MLPKHLLGIGSRNIAIIGTSLRDQRFDKCNRKILSSSSENLAGIGGCHIPVVGTPLGDERLDERDREVLGSLTQNLARVGGLDVAVVSASLGDEGFDECDWKILGAFGENLGTGLEGGQCESEGREGGHVDKKFFFVSMCEFLVMLWLLIACLGDLVPVVGREPLYRWHRPIVVVPVP
ncbi:hypothetical protein F4680DRAFT_192805 [Xylaria scruposa]|nr:hypothetical protein F4680DRAFT_192805 [Xylaria scruposa]